MQRHSVKARSTTGIATDALRDERGFTIIEVLISMVLFLIVTGAVYGLMETARADRFTTNQRVEIAQSARNALNAVGRDALNAGYEFPVNGAEITDDRLPALVGGVADADTNPDKIFAVVSGDNANDNDLNNDSATPTAKTDQVTFVFIDPTFNNNKDLVLDKVVPSGAQVEATASDVSAVTLGALYLIYGQKRGVANETQGAIGVATQLPPSGGKVNFDSGDVNDPMQINAPSASKNPIGDVDVPAQLARIAIVTYKVLQDGTMVRTEHGVPGATGGKRDVPLAYGVEDMQVRYVLKDGTLNSAPANMNDVRQVQVTVRVQSPESDRRNNQRHRITLSTTINTRNLGYDKEG